jgi:hypothetical protein
MPLRIIGSHRNVRCIERQKERSGWWTSRPSRRSKAFPSKRKYLKNPHNVRALSRELKKNKESIINGRQVTVTNECKQGVDTTEDDQLIALLKDAEMESVGDLCQE